MRETAVDERDDRLPFSFRRFLNFARPLPRYPELPLQRQAHPRHLRRSAHRTTEPICAVRPIAPSTYYEQEARAADPTQQSVRTQRGSWLKPEMHRGGPSAKSTWADGAQQSAKKRPAISVGTVAEACPDDRLVGDHDRA